MQKKTAVEISELMLSFGRRLEESIVKVKAKEDEETRNRYVETVSKIMTRMLVEVLNPLYAEHPDLIPPIPHDENPWKSLKRNE